MWSGLLLALASLGALMIVMPGRSHAGPLPALTAEETLLRDRLRLHVARMAGELGERNLLRKPALRAAAGYVEGALREQGGTLASQDFTVEGETVRNVACERAGRSRGAQIVVVGAHYDSVIGSPGANDNGSGVAALLELARLLGGGAHQRTLRLVAFVNEEPPFFTGEDMGSLRYARACRQRGDDVVAMISLETIGYYSDAPGSQDYPFPLSLFYPPQGDFIAFVGDLRSRALVRHTVGSFRRHTAFPSQAGALPSGIPGVGWSDHWAFWQAGYRAVMVTDTAPFRYPAYHTAEDTPEKLDYDRMARVVAGLARVVSDLANPD